MIIYTQNKLCAFNYNNIVDVFVNFNYIQVRTVNGETVSIANYDTEQRAKEVFNELVESLYSNITKAYIMPEK